MVKPPVGNRDAAKWLQTALNDLDIDVSPGSAGHSDVVVDAGSHRYELQLRSAAGGWPSSIRASLKDQDLANWRTVLFAREFSEGALELMRSLGLNWVDSRGNVRIVQKPALLVDRSAARTESKSEAIFQWNRSAEDIAEWVFTHPEVPIRVGDLAQDLDWSPGTVSRTLTSFDRLGWTRRTGGPRGKGVTRALAAGGEMLDSWSSWVAERQSPAKSFHALTRDPIGLVTGELRMPLDRLEKWALTGPAAGQIFAPFLTAVGTVEIAFAEPVKSDFWRSLSEVGLSEVDSGGVVNFLETDERAFRHAVNVGQQRLLSAPRVYANLIARGARYAEAAREVREARIGI